MTITSEIRYRKFVS